MFSNTLNTGFNHKIISFSKKYETNFSQKVRLFVIGDDFASFRGYNPHPQRCCSTHKCIYLTIVAPVKEKETGFPVV